jgi:hypothetical protein
MIKVWLEKRGRLLWVVLSRPLLSDLHDDLIEKIAAVEGAFAGGLDESDDAVGVGSNE